MFKTSFLVCITVILATAACSESTPPSATPPAQSQKIPPLAKAGANKAPSISIQEMLVTGPPQLKMHSLAMLSQGSVAGTVDESYLPGLKVCAEDNAVPIRSITARLLGQYFIEGKDAPNQEAVSLLLKLAKDESSDVRYNAVYHGLSQIKNKSDEIVGMLIDIAMTNRQKGLTERISDSLKNNRALVVKTLDKLLAEDSNIAVYEIYEDLTGQPPANADKYLDMPSSRPRMFIFKGQGSDPETFKAEFENELKSAGVENPSLQVSGKGENYVLLLKTYLTKDYKVVEDKFSDHDRFKIMQDMWLTPELEIQIEAMHKLRH